MLFLKPATTEPAKMLYKNFACHAYPQSLKIGFIGGGLNSAVGYTHYASSHLDGMFRLEAGCFSRDKAVNASTGSRYGVEDSRIYAHWKDLLSAEKGNLDAVVVLTPTPSHHEIVRHALIAGYPVISEKALAASIEECLEIDEALRRSEGFLAVTYNYSGYPMFRELLAQCKAGNLGTIHQILVEMPQEGFLRRQANSRISSPQVWRCHDYNIPTISLDLGVHVHHLVNLITGGLHPRRVSAIQSHTGLVDQVVDNVNALIEYDENIVANVWYGKTALGIRNGLRIRVYGSLGSGEWLQSEPESLIIAGADGAVKLLDSGSPDLLEASKSRYQRFKPGHPSGFIEAFANLYSDIATALWNRRGLEEEPTGPVMGVDHAIEGLYLMDALQKAAKSGCWVATDSNLWK